MGKSIRELPLTIPERGELLQIRAEMRRLKTEMACAKADYKKSKDALAACRELLEGDTLDRIAQPTLPAAAE